MSGVPTVCPASPMLGVARLSRVSAGVANVKSVWHDLALFIVSVVESAYTVKSICLLCFPGVSGVSRLSTALC